MRKPGFIVILLIAALGAWWLLHDGAEARVREAHAELLQFLNKTGPETDEGISIMQLRGLQDRFGPLCTVSGDSAPITGSYAPQEIVNLMVAVRTSFRTIDLRFGDIRIEFPSDATAVAHFPAELVAVDPGGERYAEMRAVESRMQEIDGVWKFVAFELTEIEMIP